MLAPVLARLDGIPGVREARADSSGRLFRIELRGGVASEGLAAAIRDVLGAGARRLDDEEARAQLSAMSVGDPWFPAAGVIALSYVEGRILAARVAAAAAARVPALGGARDALAEALRAELFATFERVHREGGRPSSGWIDDAWPGIAEAALARCAAALPAGVGAELARRLPGMLRA